MGKIDKKEFDFCVKTQKKILTSAHKKALMNNKTLIHN